MTRPAQPDVPDGSRQAVQQVSAGWYQDPAGQIRWWDGYAWGTAVQGFNLSSPPHAGPMQLPKTKPSLSKLSIAAASLTVLAWLFWLLDTIVPTPQAERCETQECWNALAEGTLNLMPEPTLFQFLGRLVVPIILTAIGLGIAGLVRSSKRPLPLVALLLPCVTILLMLIPMILMLIGLTLYGVMGASGAFG